MPVQPFAIPTALATRRRHLVYVRGTWTDPWRRTLTLDDGSEVPTKYLQAGVVTEAAAPSFSTASLLWRAGSIAWEDETAFRKRVVARLVGQFVKVVLLPAAVPTQSAGEAGAETVLFVGWVPERGHDVRGSIEPASANHRVDQVATAYGLELVLDRVAIGSTWCRRPKREGEALDTVRQIGHAVAFNEQFRRGPGALGVAGVDGTIGDGRPGNRNGATSHTASPDGRQRIGDDQGDATLPLAFAFDGGPGARPWSAYDIAEYLLAAHAPRTVTWRLSPSRPDAGASTPRPGEDPAADLFRALDDWKPGVVRTDGRTVKSILDALFDRRRGLGWRVRHEAGTDGAADAAVVEIFSILDEPVETGTGTAVPASGRRVELVLDNTVPVERLEIDGDILSRFGEVIVEGQRVLSCFTVSYDAGTLVPGWTAGQQTAYAAAAGVDDPDLNDRFRADDRFRHVFTTFFVPADWDGTVRPINYATGLPYGDIVGVNPFVLDDGTILPSAVNPFLRNWGHGFEPFIPVPTAAVAATDPSAEFLPALAILKDAAGQWVLADRPPGPGAAVRVIDRGLGVEVRASHHHVIALRDWPTGARPGRGVPAFDCRTLLLTAAFRTDDRLRVRRMIPGGLAGLVLRISIPDAEAWWVAPGTVTGVNPDGTLTVRPGGVVRNDRDRLARAAAAAAAWYGRQRQRLTLALARVDLALSVGDVLDGIVEDGGAGPRRVEIRTPVTTRTIDLDRQTTTYRTDFDELGVEQFRPNADV